MLSITDKYPARYECDVVLRDGSTLRLRPIKAGDAPALLDLHHRLSPESLYFRFFSVAPDQNRIASLANVDYENSFALVGAVADRLVAVAHYFRDEKAPDTAEVAFAIEEAFQGRGVGTRLLEKLTEIAREHHISAFEAEVLGDNRKMMDVFLRSGFEIKRRLEGGVFHVVFSTAPTADFEEKAAQRARLAATASMKAFFEPRAVAIVGAGRKRGGIGAEIFHNMVATGFQGVVYPVNPKARVVGSVRAYPRLTDIPDDLDLVVIVVPAEEVEQVVDDCIAKGVKGIVIISAGFGETGVEGRGRETALMEKVRAAGIRLIGPNCMGVLNTDPAVSLNATFSPVYPPPGRVAMSTQSGALGLAILDYARRLNIGISSFASVGNKADVSGNDLIQYWAEDPRTDVLLLYLESFGNPRNFGRIVRRIARQKPVAVVKSGRSQAGARAAASHSGALASTDVFADALFHQAGVIRTDTLEELFDVANLLAHQPTPRGRRVAILTNAGGPGILAADACEARGLEIPTLTDATLAYLRSFLPGAASVANPVDMIASAPPEHYRRCVRALLGDERVDSLIVIYIPVLVTDPQEVAEAIVEGVTSAGTADKPVLATFMRAQGAPDILGRIPTYMFPEAAASALARGITYGEWRNRPPGSIPSFPDIQSDAARAVIDRALGRGGGWLDPLEVQDLFDAVAIPVARTRYAASPDEAAAAADAIGYPVVVKAVGATILHKTEVGGVVLDLGEAAAVRAACSDMASRLGKGLSGFSIQQMIPGGVEVLVGTTVDPTFGPLVLYGSGGILVELLADVAFRIHPLTDQDAADMLDEVKGTALLRGYRGAPPADETALRDLILRVSVLLEICHEIQEMDLNPVKVLPKGAIAVDARVRVARLPDTLPTRRVVY